MIGAALDAPTDAIDNPMRRPALPGVGGEVVLARTWSRAFGVLFAVGAVSGTVLSLSCG